MSFDWRKSKQQGPQAGFVPSANILDNSDVKGSQELIQSLLAHIELQVKRTEDITGYEACGKNPYTYVVNSFINKMLLPYYAMHKLDANGIMYIATTLQNDKDNSNFMNSDGLLEQAREYSDHIEICPKLIMKAIVDKCM